MWKKLREQHEKSKAANSTEIYSLDDHIVDYELRRVKERRAHEEILSGRYRQPAFIARNYQFSSAVKSLLSISFLLIDHA